MLTIMQSGHADELPASLVRGHDCMIGDGKDLRVLSIMELHADEAPLSVSTGQEVHDRRGTAAPGFAACGERAGSCGAVLPDSPHHL